MRSTTNADFSTDDLCWNALVERDRRAVGSFVYAVKTTGVYCRPNCTSRRPNRENVVFFPGWEQAERAGYRACKRCRPKLSPAATWIHGAVIRACELIEESDAYPTLCALAEAVGLSPYHFHRLFKDAVGVTPKAYASAVRARRLQDGLSRGSPVTKAILGAGFGSNSRFYERASDMLGMPPSQYKNGAEGLVIRCAVAQCYLGWLLVAATQRGVCVIEFGDTPDTLRARLSARFPKAELHGGDPTFADWVREVLAFIEAPDRGLDLPLHIQGTAFQQRVWKALQAIPAGSTATYAEVAQRIGRKTAVRAVARACASNPLAVAVPCHRVARSNGTLGGYRWGIERKRALLASEGRARKPS